MVQITATKLENLNVLKLYEHYGALERSLPLLTPESQELAKAELEACANLRSEKIDRIYYAISSHEDALERVKKEFELLTDAKRHHDSQLQSLKGLLGWLRRSLPGDRNKITGRNYQFTLVPKKNLTVEVTSDVNAWDPEDQQKFGMIQEVTTTTQTVVRSIDGTILEEKIVPKTKTELLPNIDVIINAYQTNEQLPAGVKVTQEYAVRSKRILTERKMELDPSEYFGDVLSEAGAADQS
jgi:hypothetical protein